MKRPLLTLVFAVTALVFASCGKDDGNISGSQSGPTPEIPTTYDLARTSWVGVYEGTVVHPQATTVHFTASMSGFYQTGSTPTPSR